MESMKVHFEFSTADLAEVASRTVNRSPLVHRWRLRNSVAVGAVAGLLTFAVVTGDVTIRILAGCVALIVPFIFTYLLPRPRRNTRTEAFYRERLGGDGPFTCEVEQTSDGIVSRQLGHEVRHPWSQVASMSEVQEGIEFIYRPFGSLLVRNRAFPDPQVRADFLSFARSFIPASAPPGGAVKLVQEERPRSSPTEREYFIAWLLFFVCMSVTGSLVSAAIAAGAAAILSTPSVVPRYSVSVFAGIAFIATACLSYVFFRFFAKRLVSLVQSRPNLDAA